MLNVNYTIFSLKDLWKVCLYNLKLYEIASLARQFEQFSLPWAKKISEQAQNLALVRITKEFGNTIEKHFPWVSRKREVGSRKELGEEKCVANHL